MDKKKISNSADLTNYYNMIYDKLKKFSDVHIPYNKLAAYLKPGSENFNNFIEEDNELKDIENIHMVLRDIILDAYHGFKDGLFKTIKKEVKKFEDMSSEMVFDVSSIDKKDEYEHEKALADIYHVSLSYIELKKEEIHLYSVNVHGDIKKVIVFNAKELETIKSNIISKLCNDIRGRVTKLLFNKEISLNDLIGQNQINSMISQKISMEDVIEYITQNTGLDVTVKYLNKNELNNTIYYLFEVSLESLDTQLF